MPKKLTQEQAIEQAILVHGNRYDYSLVQYLNMNTPVVIVCPDHGPFEQTLKGHIHKGNGCTHKECVNKKFKETNLVRYGVENSAQADSAKEKYKQTCLEKYGVQNIFQNIEAKKKIKKTMMKNHGVEVPLKSKKIRKKFTSTMKERYGVEHAHQDPAIRDRFVTTMMENHGVEHAHQVPDFRDKFVSTMVEKYGVQNIKQTHMSLDTIAKLNDPDWLIEQHHNQQKTLNQIAEELGDAHYTTIGHALRKHKIEIKSFFQSFPERQVVEFIQSIHNGEIIQNTRSTIPGVELDIYLPELNLAFEFNGVYWHSELNGKNKDYHLNKTNLCHLHGIRLIHIFDAEWIDKQDIVKSRISNLLGANKTIYARKCIIQEITQPRLFLEQNHIQGWCASSINIGLIYENELVALMTFGKSRFNKNVEYELLRYVGKMETNIVGGASRLFKYFVNTYKPNSIISYSDKRWNTGNLYHQLGFQFQHDANPNYFYFHRTDSQTLYPRVKFQKHKLEKQLEIFDPNLTEWQNMQLNGYDRIWDCGNSVWIWNAI